MDVDILRINKHVLWHGQIAPATLWLEKNKKKNGKTENEDVNES